jgi:cell division protein FtsI (penicillin-binding protein 3)
MQRFTFVGFFMAFLLMTLIGQFFKIQILEGEKWALVANGQHQTVITEPFTRGTIYSNAYVKKGHPEKPQVLACDIPKFHLHVNPDLLPEKEKEAIAIKLASFQKKEALTEKLEEHLAKKCKDRRLLSFLDPDEKKTIGQWWTAYSLKRKIPREALFFISDHKRSHPFGSMLGQVLHTTRDLKDEKSGRAFPTGGLELSLDSFLQGRQGKKLVYRSPRNQLEKGHTLQAAKNGADVYLTINHYIQAICEKELEEGVKKAQAKGGWAVMMHPKTGEIYALAQYPFFHPDHYSQYYQDKEKQQETKVRAVTDAFEPGSVLKPIVMAMAIEVNETWKRDKGYAFFDPMQMIPTSKFRITGTSFRIKDLRRHNYLNMYMALQKSANIYIARIIEELLRIEGDEWFRKFLSDRYCFGKKSGIELPAEATGLVPSPEVLHANGRPQWSLPTPYVIGLGHNLTLNSIQLVKAFASIINGGYQVKPTLIKKIVDSDGKTLFSREYVQGKRVFNEGVSEEIVKALKYVTKPGGSGRRAEIKGYTSGGKSGTSEKIIGGKYSHSKYISSFIGFAPAKNPQFVLLIVVDEPVAKYVPGRGRNNQGGACAAPIFKEIASSTLEYLGVPPDDPEGIYGNYRQRDWIEEVTQLRELYNKWNQ